MYYLDTNACIDFLRGRHPSLRDRLLSMPPVHVAIPSVVKAELLLGAYKSRDRARNLEIVAQFLEPFEVVPFDDSMTHAYADIRCELERNGTVIGPNDLLIAAIVRTRDGILVTANVAELGRVPGLKVENWEG